MLNTTHEIFYQNSNDMADIPSGCIDLIVTSPPYPMIEMWDDIFSSQDSAIMDALKRHKGKDAFELMHKILDSVWDDSFRVLKNGGFICINIGDATRTINDSFTLYPNHARILQYLRKIGFTCLPDILWRKQTNAPNKFMGSGMLPAGAYVTLEHEYILIARKGDKREFKNITEKINRRESAFFWEERNIFFSDIWFDIKGTRQKQTKSKSRKRSGAFPFEIAHRLINMYSVKGDVVLDPFMGTGTTMAAAMAAARNSFGFEIDTRLKTGIDRIKDDIVDFSNSVIHNRLTRHINFVKERAELKKTIKHTNEYYGFPVITNQEKKLLFNDLLNVKQMGGNIVQVSYSEEPREQFCLDLGKIIQSDPMGEISEEKVSKKEKTLKQTKQGEYQQLELFCKKDFTKGKT